MNISQSNGVKNSMRFFFILGLGITLAWQSCSKQQTFDLNPGYDYFPLEVGKYVIYEVDSVNYNPLFQGGKKATHWEVKEQITDTFRNLSGQLVYTYTRWQRVADSLPWINPRVGERLRSNTQAEDFRENLRFISFVFNKPISDSS